MEWKKRIKNLVEICASKDLTSQDKLKDVSRIFIDYHEKHQNSEAPYVSITPQHAEMDIKLANLWLKDKHLIF